MQGLEPGPIRIRVGMHTGEPIFDPPKYVGLDVHRAARVMAAGHGGQVLLSESTRVLLDDAVPVRDLGEHRLKDLSGAQRLYQLGAEEFPRLKTLHQTNLPVAWTPLVGREREIEEVLELLRREDISVVTLTGAGGGGKTRLAMQAAAEATEDYVDGVWFVALAALTDVDLVLAAIAQTFGLREGSGRTYRDVLGDYLRSRRLLLVLDNLEQLLPEVALVVADLVTESAGIHFLATSREPLRIGAEREYPVPPLATDDGVALFAERASIELDGDRPAVAAICARLDGLPLAIELAAARVNVLPPAKLLERIEQRLPLLTVGARDAPERQQTLRATIAWSHDLLDHDEQKLFARLAVFAGGFTLEAAEAVCGANIDTLGSLLDKSLLRRDATRYRMLETIREFAVERLGEGPTPARFGVATRNTSSLSDSKRSRSSFGESSACSWTGSRRTTTTSAPLFHGCSTTSPRVRSRWLTRSSSSGIREGTFVKAATGWCPRSSGHHRRRAPRVRAPSTGRATSRTSSAKRVPRSWSRRLRARGRQARRPRSPWHSATSRPSPKPAPTRARRSSKRLAGSLSRQEIRSFSPPS